MPVSKNKRKSKEAQSRKVNRAKAVGNFGEGGVTVTLDYPSAITPATTIPGLTPAGMSNGEDRRYRVTSPPDDPELSETGQIDAIIERPVTFEMTEAHHDNVGLREIDLNQSQGGMCICRGLGRGLDVSPEGLGP